MDNHARDAFDGFSAMYNIRGASLRKGANADKSAEEGISPWKIGMLAACLLLWDLAWKVRLCAQPVTCVEIAHVMLLMCVYRCYMIRMCCLHSIGCISICRRSSGRRFGRRSTSPGSISIGHTPCWVCSTISGNRSYNPVSHCTVMTLCAFQGMHRMCVTVVRYHYIVGGQLV